MEKLFYSAPAAFEIGIAGNDVICISGNSGTEGVGYKPGSPLTDSDFE